MTTAEQAFVLRALGAGVLTAALEGWVRDLLALLNEQHPDLMALGIARNEYVAPGRIGRSNLLNACCSFWECVTLMAEDIARTGRVIAVRAALDGGETVRGLMESMHGVTPPAPGVSEYTSDRFQAKVPRK